MGDDRYPFEDPRAVLRRYGLAPKHSWGQNFLVSEGAVRRIAGLAVDEPGRLVVEIGPGLGTLTRALLGAGARVIAVERDREMCRVLEAELGDDPGLQLLEADAAGLDYAAALGDQQGAVVGNLPYQITGRIIRRLTEQPLDVMRVVLTVQSEVGDRLIAAPGQADRAALSAMVQARYRPAVAMRLRPTAFHPPPRVHSSVITLEPHTAPLFGDLAPAHFDRVVKAAFSSRRKTVRNALAAGGIGEPARVAGILERAGIDPGLRAERL
ncbi:MAG: ribosomal RNA small subunit methyltransferase A, partial [Deltaproteobacteria bacterium]|nr:ribosomal RNA small subunit methyltransferase A [Deltaproteobacteria bacterium]